MRNIFSRTRIVLGAAAIAAFSMTLLTPKPAAAWWNHPGWHHGWRGCCWGPRVVVGVPPVVIGVPPVVVGGPPVVYAPPPVYPGRVWIRPHWNGPYWVHGHWG